MVCSSVVFTLGFKRSSRASDWYSFEDAVPGLVRIAIIMTIIPNPPTHCSSDLKNKMLWGSISTF